MNPTDARKRLEELGVEYSESTFFKYVESGDAQLVALFLDAGLSPDVKDGDRTWAVLVAARAGQNGVARLLLTRGASPDPLLKEVHPRKDTWEKITASSAILNFVSSLLIAAVGGYFTYSYNQRQIDLNRIQNEHDSASKEQANRVLELEAIQKLIPILTSSDENGKTVALIAIKRLAHPDLATDLAQFYGGPGSIRFFQQVAVSSTNPKEKAIAVGALSRIVATGDQTNSKLASRALENVFESISPDWEKPAPNESKFESPGGVCGPSGDGGDPATNLRRNRTDVPASYHEVTFRALQALPFPNAPSLRKSWSDEQLAVIQPFEGIPVTVTGYLLKLRPQVGSGESTNCHLIGPDEVDWHMALAENPGQTEDTAIVVEVTPRVRQKHPNWTADALKPWLSAQVPIRVSGFTLLDPDHRNQIGRLRSTLWEVHPITKIEVYKGGQWVSLDDVK